MAYIALWSPQGTYRRAKMAASACWYKLVCRFCALTILSIVATSSCIAFMSSRIEAERDWNRSTRMDNSRRVSGGSLNEPAAVPVSASSCPSEVGRQQ